MAISSDFSKEKRLLNSADFSRVFEQVEIKYATKHYLFLARHNRVKQARLGLVISKKHIKTAVNRNRIKRIVRDGFRNHQHKLNNLDIIFISRRHLGMMENMKIHQSLANVWQKFS